MRARRLSTADTNALVARKRELIDAARPFMRALSLAAGNERHAAMLGDESGVVLDIVADEETAYRTEGFPVPGTLLSEAVAGANGIGTPLVEDGYVELVGPEHFIEGFHVYTCQGLPLRGPTGEVVGVLSTSVRRVEAAGRIHEILVCGAHGIEAELSQRRLADELRTVLLREASAAQHLEALRQDVTQLQAAARLRIEKAARLTRSGATCATDLVRAATELMDRFGDRARLWRDIAFEEKGMAQTIELCERVDAVCALFATEAAIRRVEIRVRRMRSVRVRADPRELTRTLFRTLLRALDAGPESSRAELTVEVGVSDDARAFVRVTPSPEPSLYFDVVDESAERPA